MDASGVFNGDDVSWKPVPVTINDVEYSFEAKMT
jgi:hypothetical protein